MKNRLWIALCFLLLPGAAGATDITEIKSGKGFTAWLVEEHSLPLISVQIAFKGGGIAYDPQGKEGRANLAAALLTEGAGDKPAKEFHKALESRAMQFNTSVDADVLAITMSSLSEYKQDAFAILGDVLTQPRFDDVSIDEARRQTLSLIKRQEQEPGYLLSRRFDELAFGAHPYSLPPLGKEASLKSLQRYDFQEYAKRYLAKDNILIAVVGDITAEEVSRLLDAHLGTLPDRSTPDSQLAEASVAKSDGKAISIEYNIPQTMVAFGGAGLKRSDPDYLAAYVMNQIIGGGGSLTSRLGIEIREKRGLAYSVATMLDPMASGASWQGRFATRTEKTQEALDVLRDTLQRFASEGPTDQELSDAKRYLTGSFVLNLDSNPDMAAFLVSMQLNRLGKDYINKRNDLINAVSKEDVARLAGRLTDPKGLLLVTIGQAAGKGAK